jgi:hypothetical protein
MHKSAKIEMESVKMLRPKQRDFGPLPIRKKEKAKGQG